MLCRICLVQMNLEKFNLFESLINSRKLAVVIEYCFDVEILEDEENNEICLDCKNDLESAYRFVKKLRYHSHSTRDADETFEQHKLIDDDYTSSVLIAEIESNTEQLLESIEQNPETLDSDDIEPSEPTDDLNNTQKTELDQSCFDDFDFWSDETDSVDEEQNLSSDEEHAEEAQPRKRLYYGVKSNSQPKRCCECKEPLDSQEKVTEHSELYHQQDRITNPKDFGDRRFECSVCFKRFGTKKLYLQHQRKMYVDVLHPCPRCKEEFANLYVLKKHIKFDHKKKTRITELEELRRQSNICCGCKEQFSTPEALKEHVNEVHYPNHVLSDSSNTFECNVCYNRFKTYKSLKHHQLRFYKEKKFVCTLCGKSFREKVRLAEHENSHRKIRQFLCSYCPATFAIKNSYDVHVKMHETEARYNCEYCGKEFQKKRLLEIHLQTHNHQFKCHLCPFTSTRQNILDSHVLGSHSDAGKPFKCKECTSSYIHQRDLRRHTREKHEGIRSFKCNKCPKAYIRKKLLQTHLKSHEKEIV